MPVLQLLSVLGKTVHHPCHASVDGSVALPGDFHRRDWTVHKQQDSPVFIGDPFAWDEQGFCQ